MNRLVTSNSFVLFYVHCSLLLSYINTDIILSLFMMSREHSSAIRALAHFIDSFLLFKCRHFFFFLIVMLPQATNFCIFHGRHLGEQIVANLFTCTTVLKTTMLFFLPISFSFFSISYFLFLSISKA